MLKSIRVRRSQGSQFIPDPRQANPVGFRGRPVIADRACETGCQACETACPTRAITLQPAPAEPVSIDLGRCVTCGDCAPACPSAKLSFSNDFKLASTTREGLVLSATRPAPDPVQVSAALRQRFGRSLKLRSVSAGGCNACELEVNALSNVNFDIGRYGIDIVASPRHADGLVLTGPITRNMALALQSCWDAMPAPKLVIAVGACAISGSPFEGSSAIERSFLERFQPTLYLPGCPPHPLSFVCGVLDLLGIAS
ncbi:MAG: NADH:ubiquinone oxidoreductase [Burkholderiales bacterium RIFCSPHIGHO2_12_FULL_69_20]|nr:MAG: NADH:ubiquinone oxidoreductase [Burkholderiales bacterium RIFCSPHIGHO2_12_FULL_69_20]